MPAFLAPLLISGISALAGGLGNKKTIQQQSSTTNSNSTTNTSPNYDPAQLDIRNYLLRTLMGGVESQPDFERGYLNDGISKINQSAGAASNNIRQLLVSRGIGRTSAGISPEIAAENARFGQVANFTNTAPLAMEDIRRKRLLDFAQFFSSLPVGSTSNTTGMSTTNGTSTAPGNPWGGAVQNGAQMAAFLYGNGAFNPKNNTDDYGN